MAKPILSLKKNKPQVEAKPELILEEAPFNPLTAVELPAWDYTPDDEFAPRQRNRRKDKPVEQYRKDSKWQ